MSEQAKVTGIVLSVYPVGENDQPSDHTDEGKREDSGFCQRVPQAESPSFWRDRSPSSTVSL